MNVSFSRISSLVSILLNFITKCNLSGFFSLEVNQPLQTCSSIVYISKPIKLAPYQVHHTFQMSTQNNLLPFLQAIWTWIEGSEHPF